MSSFSYKVVVNVMLGCRVTVRSRKLTVVDRGSTIHSNPGAEFRACLNWLKMAASTWGSG